MNEEYKAILWVNFRSVYLNEGDVMPKKKESTTTTKPKKKEPKTIWDRSYSSAGRPRRRFDWARIRELAWFAGSNEKKFRRRGLPRLPARKKPAEKKGEDGT